LLFGEVTIYQTASNSKVMPGETIEFEDKGFSFGVDLLACLKKMQTVPWIVDVDRVFVRIETRTTNTSVADGDASLKQDIAVDLKAKFCRETEKRGFERSFQSSKTCQYILGEQSNVLSTHKALQLARMYELLSSVESILL
jgi:hypothetical protein